MEDKYLLSEEKLTEIAVGLNISLKQVTATLDLLASKASRALSME